MNVIVLAALALIFSLQQELAHAQCAEVFSTSRSFVVFDSTDGLISYLNQLLENNAIGERELVTLREGANPIPHKATGYGPVFDSAARQIQYDVVQRHMQSGILDHARIKAWVDQKLKGKAEVRESREEARVETQDVYRKMEFNRLPPGEFEVGWPNEIVRVRLTHSIEMMSTLISQRMWVDVMGVNPARFKDGPESEIGIDGNRIRMQPDHPVEQITWWSLVVFANRLSQKRGLKPVYDLSEVETMGQAEDGTLQVISGKVKIHASAGDIYQTEGFRLPTMAEQQYVRQGLSKIAPDDLVNYGWFSENSAEVTHAIGTTPRSLSINGKIFDDLIGNVAEWSHDFLDDIVDGTNPVGDSSGEVRGITVGALDESAEGVRFRKRLLNFANQRRFNLGGRLVRTVK